MSPGATQNQWYAPAHVRMPHDASVFVASLPTHLDEPELQSRLLEHLGQFATIKHLKLIKDNRGAICAFVQAENATQARSLIDACNHSFFMDRTIRCERARAFRTLLIAWAPNANSDEERQPVRLRRLKNGRYVSVTQGPEALIDSNQMTFFSGPREDDPLCGEGLLFPNGFSRDDFSSFKTLLESFGPMEYLVPYDPAVAAQHHQHRQFGQQDGNESDEATGPGTLNVRSGEEGTVDMWAAKWAHRNDAVAVMQGSLDGLFDVFFAFF
ncbi:hypothetical protein M422DRAFT_785972 [Sphaerobolus stellatus SS14]|uniref:RRM domain-containing protein n=1 Tax=Sphaerobolus stellatus (strain SS14) TaxID=990650 RepID=A0A0C9UFT5_SPHS4|nr:hypothetical protein M422DRAFT_785972 [Sphaerobolus stellatus SS14]